MQHLPLQQHVQKVIPQSCWLEAAPCPSMQTSSLCYKSFSFVYSFQSLKESVHKASAKASSKAGTALQVGNYSAICARISYGRTKNLLWGTRRKREETTGRKGSDVITQSKSQAGTRKELTKGERGCERGKHHLPALTIF